MSVYIPSALLSQNNYLTWTDPHCKVINNGTHYISTVSHTACGTIVKFTHDEVIFENDIFIRQLGATPPTSPNDTIDFGSDSVDTISVQCIYPRRQNVTMSYRPANTHIRFYEKRYGHMDVQLEQYQSDKFVSVISGTSYPREVLLNKDMYIKLRAMHTNTTDIAIKVDSCVATPSAMPADGSLYQLIDHGCPASPAVKLYPSSFDEVKFSVKAFQFKSSPGSIVYIHCQISVCSPTNPQCVTGCKSRHRRDVDEADDSSHLVSGGPYLLVADKGSLQMSTVVAGVCACLAVVATVFAVIGWKRKSTKYNLVS